MDRPHRHRGAPAGVLLAAALALAGCTPAGDGPAPGGGTGAGGAGTAAAALGELAVAPAGSSSGYERDEFGRSWADTDGNGCGTRDDILARDLTGVDREDGCTVVSGTLTDPYTGTRIRFERGRSRIDIDHVVALSDAWPKGASEWDRSRRTRFANDPLNLLAVEARANRTKGDGDATEWLPPDESFHCAYVARQVAVKKKYELEVTKAEKAAMEKVLADCPGERLPTGGKPQAPTAGETAADPGAPGAPADPGVPADPGGRWST
ncbi:DUF1524 domain-containing protein [Streptomyces sp. SCUT-3]|uniref:HNH endonuclease family protein n=1 Tax=Streptomyces sp. SCUT-3 TaxID=2684469 RepID=UPI0015FADD55|nr:HNH endonuclease family protein [Streptomyces sp. SCUT-3]QMV23115.1 DUF1524 domain-containing protein [Streptomyces sp. SCUT-3]